MSNPRYRGHERSGIEHENALFGNLFLGVFLIRRRFADCFDDPGGMDDVSARKTLVPDAQTLLKAVRGFGEVEALDVIDAYLANRL
jgi:hypothetical protein